VERRKSAPWSHGTGEIVGEIEAGSSRCNSGSSGGDTIERVERSPKAWSSSSLSVSNGFTFGEEANTGESKQSGILRELRTSNESQEAACVTVCQAVMLSLLAFGAVWCCVVLCGAV